MTDMTFWYFGRFVSFQDLFSTKAVVFASDRKSSFVDFLALYFHTFCCTKMKCSKLANLIFHRINQLENVLNF